MIEDFAQGITIGFFMGIFFSLVAYILKNNKYI
jgi:hypothetical protein